MTADKLQQLSTILRNVDIENTGFITEKILRVALH